MSVIVRRPIICVLTRARGRAGSPEREALLARLEAAASAGATMIQVRERQLDDRQLITFVREKLAMPVITWTVRDEAGVQRTFEQADQMTFEGFDPYDETAPSLAPRKPNIT